jgi:hypothetical protein
MSFLNPSITISFISLCLSALAVSIVVFDRRTKLLVRLREGKWIELSNDMLLGVIEIYNRSTRPNAITSYKYEARDTEGKWVRLESERYELHNPDQGRLNAVHNETPLLIAPYSGVAVRIACFGTWDNFPQQLEIKLSIQDLFEKGYTIPINLRRNKQGHGSAT